MTSPVAVIGLVWDGLDIQRSDLDLFFEITEGMDDLPSTRGDDQVLPFRVGRLAQPRIADTRPVVATGWAAGSGTVPRSRYRNYVDELKAHLDPTKGPRILVATLEDGSTRWVSAVPRNMIGGDGIGGEFRALSIEWQALDPYWYGTWGTLALDNGLLLDGGSYLDTGADIVVVPTTQSHEVSIDTLGTADVEWINVRFTGPSVGNPGFMASLPNGETVGFTFGALLAGETPSSAAQVLFVANHQRLVQLDGAAKRNLLALGSGNLHGEYARLGPGINSVRILGQPAEARIKFNPTYS